MAEVTPADRMWQAAAAELSPEKSLARVDQKAQFVVSTVTLVASLLTGLGLVGADQLLPSSTARTLAIAAVAVALVAAVLGLGAALLRFSPAVAPGNLAEVEAWYRRQFRRAWAVVAAGWLLLIAVVLAGIAAIAAIASDGGGEPALSIQTTGTGADAVLEARAELRALEPGERVTTQVVGTNAGGTRTTLARAVTRAGRGGTATVTLKVDELAGYEAVAVTTTSAARTCTATLPEATVSCG